MGTRRTWPGTWPRNVATLRKAAAEQGKAVGFASEIMARPWDPLCGDIDVMASLGLGWFAWELMVSNSGWGVPKCAGCPLYQGIIWPNGTAYSREEVACIAASTGVGSAPGLAGSSGAGRVQWVPVAAAVRNVSNVLAPRYAPAGAWRITGAGSSFLPWDNKPWRGQMAVLCSTPHASATLAVQAGVTAVDMYFSTSTAGAVLRVVVDAAQAGTVNLTAAGAPTHANRVRLAGGLDAARAHTIELVMAAGAGTATISGFDVWF